MNIVIDQGNKAFKIGIFEEKKLLKFFQTSIVKKRWLNFILKTYQPQKGIWCNTKKENKLLNSFFQKKIPKFYEVTSHLPIPLEINYQTPLTLGSDRIASAVGAWSKKPDNNLLIIDIGTAITIDFVSKVGVYIGGNISAGVNMRLNSLHQFANKLPKVKKKGDLPSLGYSTDTAIRSGVIGGIVRELNSYIEEYIRKKQAIPFVTGGNGSFFKKRLNSNIFIDKYLVLRGLNEILTYQEKIN